MQVTAYGIIDERNTVITVNGNWSKTQCEAFAKGYNPNMGIKRAALILIGHRVNGVIRQTRYSIIEAY